MRPKAGLVLLLGLATVPWSGCVDTMVAKMIVKAPNQQRVPAIVRNRDYARKYDGLYTQAWRVSVGPPAAELSVAMIEPGDYHFKYEIVFWDDEHGQRRYSPRIEWTVPKHPPPKPPPARGTVVLLHGYMETKEDMVHWALRLAESGYRAVLVDFRGQGRSTGPWIGFGAFEAHDLMQVLDDLQAKGLVSEKIGVLGISYGASVALLWAARDSRVGAVVALAPFSSGERAPLEFGRATLPRISAIISDADFEIAATKAARLAGFSWSDADPLTAVEHMAAPVLYFHGAKDVWISPDNSRRLYAHTAGAKAMGILDQDDHVLLSLRLDPISRDVIGWFGKWLRSAGPGPGRPDSVSWPSHD